MIDLLRKALWELLIRGCCIDRLNLHGLPEKLLLVPRNTRECTPNTSTLKP